MPIYNQFLFHENSLIIFFIIYTLLYPAVYTQSAVGHRWFLFRQKFIISNQSGNCKNFWSIFEARSMKQSVSEVSLIEEFVFGFSLISYKMLWYLYFVYQKQLY